MEIKTKYININGSGKIMAWAYDNGKKRQLTIPYPYQLHQEAKHTLAAQTLYVKLFGKRGLFLVECVGTSACAYKFDSIED